MPQRPRARPLVSYSASAFPSCLSAVAKATVSLLAVEGARLIDRDTGALIVRIEAKRDDRIVRYAFERFGESLVVGHAARLLFGGVFGLANHANRTCDGSVLIVQGLGTLDRAADAFVLARGVAHDPERAIHIAAAVVVSHELDAAFAACTVARLSAGRGGNAQQSGNLHRCLPVIAIASARMCGAIGCVSQRHERVSSRISGVIVGVLDLSRRLRGA